MRSLRVLPFAAALAALAALAPAAMHGGPGSPLPRCGTTPTLGRHLVESSRAHEARGGARQAGRARSVAAAGDVAVLVDDRDLVIRRNPFDLDGAGLRFTTRPGGFAVARVDRPVESATTAIPLAADGVAAVELPFAFPFFGAAHARVYVHADGVLTFDAVEGPYTTRDLGAFADGPPRVAVLFADLDPSRGGQVGLRAEAGRVVFVWRDVPGAAQIDANTFSVALHADGTIDMAWERVGTRAAIVGVTPGRGRAPSHLDLGAGGSADGPVVERFHETEELDLAAAVRRLIAAQGDVYQQLVVYTTRPLNPVGGTLAFQVNVRNAVAGIGLGQADDGPNWGSPAALESVVFMDAVDTFQRADAFEILGHEIGHRWLARARYRAPGGPSDALLGRALVHWSFFLATDASVLEGNAIEDLGGGRFRTTDIARRFSPLDQYLMGLRAPAEVPSFFYVDEPDDFRPDRAYKPSSGPEAGVSFDGTRRDVHIEDVLAEMGPRVPAAGAPSPPWRVAFVLVADERAPATPERIAIADRIRSRLPEWYRAATDGRGTIVTRLAR